MLHVNHIWIRFICLSLLCLLCACATQGKGGMRHRYLMTPPQQKIAVRACDDQTDPSTWGVIIGVNHYQDKGITDLKGSVADAWIMYHYLTSPRGGKVNPKQLKLLLNQEATRSNVEGAIGNFLSQSCPKDKILIYFAGHGAPEPGRPNDAFLLMHDTKLDNMVGSAVSMQRLPKFLKWRNASAGNLLLIVDACHSGNITFPQQRGVKKPPKVEALERSKVISQSLTQLSKNEKQWSVISAAAGNQYAGELKGTCGGDVSYTGGLFTCKLLQALSGKADQDKNGQMSIQEIYQFVHQEVSKETGGVQTPVFSGATQQTASFFKVPKKRKRIDIPKIPKAYKIKKYKSPLGVYRWVSYGLTATTALLALYFNSDSNSLTREGNQFLYRERTESEYNSLMAERDASMNTAQMLYGATGLLGLTSLVLTLMEYYDKPQGRSDVYKLKPWFSLPVNQAAVSGVGFKF